MGQKRKVKPFQGLGINVGKLLLIILHEASSALEVFRVMGHLELEALGQIR